MNASQRKDIVAISLRLAHVQESEQGLAYDLASAKLQTAKEDFRAACEDLADYIDDIKSDIDEHASEESDKLSNMPESLQGSASGEAMQEAIDSLESAASEIDMAVENLRNEDFLGEDNDDWESPLREAASLLDDF